MFDQVQLTPRRTIEREHFVVRPRFARVRLKGAVDIQVCAEPRDVDAIELRLVERVFEHDKALKDC